MVYNQPMPLSHARLPVRPPVPKPPSKSCGHQTIISISLHLNIFIILLVQLGYDRGQYARHSPVPFIPRIILSIPRYNNNRSSFKNRQQNWSVIKKRERLLLIISSYESSYQIRSWRVIHRAFGEFLNWNVCLAQHTCSQYNYDASVLIIQVSVTQGLKVFGRGVTLQIRRNFKQIGGYIRRTDIIASKFLQ